ncbi:MAG: energy transducer TonB, partial [Syntrophothermus sp.]
FLLTLVILCSGQTAETKYFNNQWLETEVPVEKGKFSQTIIKNDDGSITTEVKNIKKDEILSRETYKGDEPYGVWVYRSGKESVELDYNFPLKYADENCYDSISQIVDHFSDDEKIGYVAPKLSTGEPDIHQFLVSHLKFPNKAKEEGIQGRVYVVFTIKKDGSTDNIFVKKGSNIILDKEAVRTLRELKFSSPPTLQGKPQSFCVTMPISFVMR